MTYMTLRSSVTIITIMPTGAQDISLIDPQVLSSAFLEQPASKSLRVTCYGSSSAKTPEAYLKAARSLGYSLAKRGHVCVNGAGPFGCMAAMNDGCVIGEGHIVGVIHKMFLVDSGYFAGKQVNFDDVGTHRAFNDIDSKAGIIREIVVAGGTDLQERKRLLVDKADALVVLPGGPGTWDELWEMCCCRHLGLTELPIVCINIDNYYQPFLAMLQRAHQDELIKLPPHKILHFSDSVEEAIQWIESENAGRKNNRAEKNFKKRPYELKGSSFLSPLSTNDDKSKTDLTSGFMFIAGVVTGAALYFGSAGR